MAKIKYINKHFASDILAANYQNQLYKKYDSVKLLRAPISAYNGIYAWEVSQPIKTKKSK